MLQPAATILVLYSKHMHIFLAPFNVLFSRRPNGLGPLLPMYSGAIKPPIEVPKNTLATYIMTSASMKFGIAMPRKPRNDSP